MRSTKEFSYGRVGDVISSSGIGWEYKQIGDLACFTQEKKIPSLRVVKTLLKLLNKLTEEV